MLPPKVWDNFFPKKFSYEKTKTFLGKKNYGEVVRNRTNDQIMPGLGGVSEIINACISRPNLNTKSSLEH